MARPGPLPQTYITRPSPDKSEGELDLSASAGDGRDAALLFAQQLAQQLIDEKVWSISSLHIDWAGPPGGGRLYGQMWLERKGASVHFIGGRLYSGGGSLVALCSATAHIAPGDSIQPAHQPVPGPRSQS
ncbi:MAG: hypothetical protein IIA59_10795 [Candidatus Marinimicrobia bacterium]|nr:hypothetical protein [Candidatus Neomarinimicrobiota bacterium]